jgi:hypothetical protein
MSIDTRYRDICLAGANLHVNEFDPNTGQARGATPTSDYEPSCDEFGDDSSGCESFEYYFYQDLPESAADAPSLFDEYFTGNVSGAKPDVNQCMPMKDTPLIPLDPSDPNQAFSYFMNLDNNPFYIPGRVDPNDTNNPYHQTNYYRNETFFIGGVSGCPDVLDFNPDSPPDMSPHHIPEYAKLNAFKAEWCADEYALRHAAYPYFTMERPGIATDDPLSQQAPDKSYLNNCQPLLNGDDAYEVQYHNGDPMKAGFAPVWSYIYSFANENEYVLSDRLQRDWDAEFSGSPGGYKIKGIPLKNTFPTIGLPCVRDSRTPNFIPTTYFLSPTPPAVAGARRSIRCSPDSPPDSAAESPATCQNPWRPIPSDMAQTSQGIMTPSYCPNVEKITTPSNPYAPRDEVSGATDRDYSDRTSEQIQIPDLNCRTTQYRDYTPYNDPAKTTADPQYKLKHPTVQCAIVPVDILSMRAAQFDNCITQRININYDSFVLWVNVNRTAAGFTPPCATRYWETDSVADCDVPMSIQQCCHIIVKDVVPSNFLKLRTCEGVMQQRFSQATGWQGLLAEGITPSYSADAAPPPPATCMVVRQDDQQYAIGYTGGINGNMLYKYDSGYLEAYSIDSGGNLTRQANSDVHSYRTHPFSFKIAYNEFCGTQPKTVQMDSYGITMADGKPDKTLVALMRAAQGTACSTEPRDYLFMNQPGIVSFNNPGPDAGVTPIPGVTPGTGLLGAHMPYMRWWDTGASAGNSWHGGHFENTLGSWDTIIGVGHEERNNDDAASTAYRAGIAGLRDSRLLDWLRSPNPAEMGRIFGWMGLKMEQMLSVRQHNDYCIPRYEKMFKYGGPEALVLAKAGAGYTTRTDGSNHITSVEKPWTLGWRGYASDTHGKGFPSVGAAGWNTALQGLDNALPGDIISYNLPNGMPQLAYVTNIGGYARQGYNDPLPGEVKAVFNQTTKKYELNGPGGEPLHPTRLFVVSWDQGKFPSATGTSVTWGLGPERVIYKRKVSPQYQEEICSSHSLRALTNPYDALNPSTGGISCRDFTNDNLNAGTCLSQQCQPSCVDPTYTACVLPNGAYDWDEAKIYRPSLDVLQCTGAEPLTQGGMPTAYSLAQTYAWTGLQYDANAQIIPSSIPGNNVVTQGETSKIDSNIWAYCVNAGADPPQSYPLNYKGPQTGAITKTNLCGPEWHVNGSADTGCRANTNVYQFFPSSNIPQACRNGTVTHTVTTKTVADWISTYGAGASFNLSLFKSDLGLPANATVIYHNEHANFHNDTVSPEDGTVTNTIDWCTPN